MNLNEQQLAAYKDMAKDNVTMEMCIWAWLAANCEKFDDSKMESCMEHLYDVASDILDEKNGEIPEEVCYRICLDYFDDEMWKKEDEMEAKKKAERETLAAKQKAKNIIKKTKTGDIFKCSIDEVKGVTVDTKKIVPEPPKAPQTKKTETTQLSLF